MIVNWLQFNRHLNRQLNSQFNWPIKLGIKLPIKLRIEFYVLRILLLFVRCFSIGLVWICHKSASQIKLFSLQWMHLLIRSLTIWLYIAAGTTQKRLRLLLREFIEKLKLQSRRRRRKIKTKEKYGHRELEGGLCCQHRLSWKSTTLFIWITSHGN